MKIPTTDTLLDEAREAMKLSHRDERDIETNIKRLNARHRLIVFNKAQGMSNIEIARRYEMSEKQIGIIVQSPLFTKAVEKLQDALIIPQVKSYIEDVMPDAALKVHDLMLNAKSEQVQLKAASEFLNRGLGRAHQTVEVSGKIDLRAVYLRLDQMAIEAKEVDYVDSGSGNDSKLIPDGGSEVDDNGSPPSEEGLSEGM